MEGEDKKKCQKIIFSTFFYEKVREREEKKMEDWEGLEPLDPDFIDFIGENSSSLDSQEEFSRDEIDDYCTTQAISEIEQQILSSVFVSEDSEYEHQKAVAAGAEFLNGRVKTCATHATNLPQGRIEFGTIPAHGVTWMAAVVIPLAREKSGHPWFFITDTGLGRSQKMKACARRVVLNETLSCLDHAFGLSSSGLEVTREGLNLVAALDSKAKKLVTLDIYIWFNMYQCILQWARTGHWNDEFFEGARYEMPKTLQWFQWKLY